MEPVLIDNLNPGGQIPVAVMAPPPMVPELPQQQAHTPNAVPMAVPVALDPKDVTMLNMNGQAEAV